MQTAPVASIFVATGRPASLLALALLGGCAAWQDALRFEARLYQDRALLDGLRGHAVLERVADADGTLRYADPTVQARFGLGLDGRLARLDYTGIPEPVYCEHQPGAEAPAVRATARPGPRPPPPRPDPNAPVQTNIRQGDGNNGPG